MGECQGTYNGMYRRGVTCVRGTFPDSPPRDPRSPESPPWYGERGYVEREGAGREGV